MASDVGEARSCRDAIFFHKSQGCRALPEVRNAWPSAKTFAGSMKETLRLICDYIRSKSAAISACGLPFTPTPNSFDDI
jgi:hypothetical protein